LFVAVLTVTIVVLPLLLLLLQLLRILSSLWCAIDAVRDVAPPAIVVVLVQILPLLLTSIGCVMHAENGSTIAMYRVRIRVTKIR
jgi:uncharacterized membrane protein